MIDRNAADGGQLPACVATDVRHRYGNAMALDGVDLVVNAGQIVALLGPNGSGKTTLFRLLCTLVPLQHGTIEIAGVDVRRDPLGVRGRIGIVFQSPSLDPKLTVDENVACQAALYGIGGEMMRQRRDEVLARMGLTDRRRERCESLSGGLRRRVELAKGMLHRPRLMLMDEPSTGLDPAARRELWDAVRSMADSGVAVLMTTHLMEEADKADRVAIMAAGKKIAEGTPGELRQSMGDGFVTVTAADLDAVAARIHEELDVVPLRVQNQLRLQTPNPASLVPMLAQRFGDQLDSITVGRPTLEDVFIARTGRSFVEPSPTELT